MVADDADALPYFHTASEGTSQGPTSAASSYTESTRNIHPLDFTIYTDQAPLTVQSNTPPELLQQIFAKLGAKYVIVTDPNGNCRYLNTTLVFPG